VHNLHFESGDVDHVAIGPAGVLVIETKSSSADWDWLERQEIPKRWAQQATQGAFRVRHLIRQRAGEQVDTIPILAMWVSDQPEGARSVHGVTGVRGKDLAGVVRSLTGPALTPDQIERIHDALSVAGQQFDEYVGVEHSGPLRRLFE
jgi:hypothetical protein